jgi:hypothetical protein
MMKTKWDRYVYICRGHDASSLPQPESKIMTVQLYRSLERLHLAIKACAGIGFDESSPTTNAHHASIWNDLNEAQADAELKLKHFKACRHVFSKQSRCCLRCGVAEVADAASLPVGRGAPDDMQAPQPERVDCPVCGHYAHQTRTCKGGMGDYCDCQYDSQEGKLVLTDEQLSQGTFNCPVCGLGTPHHHSQPEALQPPSVEAVTKECNFTALGLWCDVHGYKECPYPRCVAIPTSKGA